MIEQFFSQKRVALNQLLRIQAALEYFWLPEFQSWSAFLSQGFNSNIDFVQWNVSRQK